MIAIAFVGIAQFGTVAALIGRIAVICRSRSSVVSHAIFAVLQGTSVSADVFAGGNVRTGRQHAADFTVQNAVDIGYALGAAIGILE